MTAVETVAGKPAPRHEGLAGDTFDRKLRLDPTCLVVMQVLPALPPDGGAARPTLVVASEENLECLGEARLARTIPSDHEREPGPGSHVQCRRGANPAKPL